MSELVLQLLTLIIPGMVFMTIMQHSSLHNKLDKFYFILYSSISSLFLYIITHKLVTSFSDYELRNTVLEFIKGKQRTIQDPNEIVFTLYTAMILASVISILKTTGILNEILMKLKITDKFDKPSVFTYFLSNKDIGKWITIRDMEKNLCYFGWLLFYSEPEEKEQSIAINNVSVYQNDTAKLIYECDNLYIPFDHKTMIIESNHPEENGNTQKSETEDQKETDKKTENKTKKEETKKAGNKKQTNKSKKNNKKKGK